MESMLGGQLATRMDGDAPYYNWHGDLEQIRSAGSQYLINGGMANSLAPMRLEEGKPVPTKKQQNQINRELDQLMREAFAKARVDLEQNWDFMNYATDTVMKRGTLDEKALQELRRESICILSPAKFPSEKSATNSSSSPMRWQENRGRPKIKP